MAIDLAEIQFSVIDPSDVTLLPDVRCEEMAELAVRAFRSSNARLSDDFRRTRGEIRHFVGADDMDAYVDAQRDPQSLVDTGRFRRGQRLSRPLIALAVNELDNLVGFASTVDNVSGSERAQQLKIASRFKNHRLLRMIAVEPDYQQQGIGRGLALLSWETAKLLQPASAYMNANEWRYRDSFLRQIGLKADHEAGHSYPQSYGPGTREALQVRYHHPAPGGARAAARHIRSAYPEVAAKVS